MVGRHVKRIDISSSISIKILNYYQVACQLCSVRH